MFTSGGEPASSGPGLARQIIDLYVVALGPWAAPIVAVSILSVMTTTCMAAFDSYPRGIWAAVAALKGPPEERAPEKLPDLDRTTGYRAMLVGMMLFAQFILVFYFTGFTALIDLVTTISFLAAPLFAWLNHRVMHSPDLPLEARPPRWLSVWSRIGILFFAGFALFYLWVIFA
jgi:amino acid transporter